MIAGHPAFAALYELETGKLVYAVVQYPYSYHERPEQTATSWGGAFTPDGSHFLVAEASGNYHYYETSSGEEIKRFRLNGLLRVAHNLEFIDNSTFFGNSSEASWIVDLPTLNTLSSFENFIYYDVSNDYKKILMYNVINNNFVMYDTIEKTIETELSQEGLGSSIFDISPNNEKILFGSILDFIQNPRQILDVNSKTTLREYPLNSMAEENSPESEDTAVGFFPDGKKFFTLNGKTIHIYDVTDLNAEIKEPGLFESGN